ncbi:MAG: molybdopterin molybdotransferase MoeA [Anaerolineae bacterium]
MSDLLSVDDAIAQILERFSPLPAEEVTLATSLGRILANDIVAAENIPPFANSSMDGFALRAEDIVLASENNPIQLSLVMDIPAGKSPKKSIKAGQAARIMTGAAIPDGANAVVPVESTDSAWSVGDRISLPGTIRVFRSLKQGDYVRPVGEDIRNGQKILTAGAVIRPAEIGVMASLGCAHVPVTKQPRVAILSTGNELVSVSASLSPGKIRDSNSHALAALVTTAGAIPIHVPRARDRLDDVRKCFRKAIALAPDMIISSAGVSVGAFDVVRTVIDELGSVDFWRINLRPGKPLAFGQVGGIPFFGLPGNPVSAMVTFEVFVRPSLLKMAHRPDNSQVVTARLAEDLTSDGRRSYLRAKLLRENGEWIAHMTGTQSSGALMSMVLADGLMIVPEDVHYLAAGSPVQVRLLRELPY